MREMWSQGLLTRVRDSNKHVQEAACSALATLEEAAGRELLESSRITAILKTLAAALQVLCAPQHLLSCSVVALYLNGLAASSRMHRQRAVTQRTGHHVDNTFKKSS